MAYRAPKLMFLHAARDAGDGNVTVSGAATGFPASRLYDDAKVPLFRFDLSAADQWIKIDRGATQTGNQQVDRLLIPSGHNLDGASVVLEGSATGAFSGEEVTLHSFSGSAGLIHETFVAPIGHRYLRLRVSTVGQWELGELVLTRARTVGVGIAPDFHDFAQRVFSETITRAGESYRAVLSAQQRVIRLVWPRLPAADMATFDDLGADSQDGVRAFWLEPPDDAKAVLHVKAVEGQIPRRNASGNPQGTGIEDRAELELIEALE